jgi:hypothetical protein
MKCDPYALACNNDPTYILGLRMIPLSLGHILLFQRLDLPFYNQYNDNQISPEDLIIGTLICSMTYKEFMEMANTKVVSFWSIENIKSFGRAYYYSSKYGYIGWQVRRWSNTVSKHKNNVNLFFENNKFINYLTTKDKEPMILNINDEQKTSQSPWVLNLLNVLISNLHYSYEDALEIPYLRALWEYFKYCESQGAIEFVNVESLEASGLINKI